MVQKADLANPGSRFSARPGGVDQEAYREIKNAFDYINRTSKYIQERIKQINSNENSNFQDNIEILDKIHSELNNLPNPRDIQLSDTILSTALKNYIETRLKSEQKLSIDWSSQNRDKFLADFVEYLADRFTQQYSEVKEKHPMSDTQFYADRLQEVKVQQFQLDDFHHTIRRQNAEIGELKATIAGQSGAIAGQEKDVEAAVEAKETAEKQLEGLKKAVKGITRQLEQADVERYIAEDQRKKAESELQKGLRELPELRAINAELSAGKDELERVNQGLDEEVRIKTSQVQVAEQKLEAEKRKVAETQARIQQLQSGLTAQDDLSKLSNESDIIRLKIELEEQVARVELQKSILTGAQSVLSEGKQERDTLVAENAKLQAEIEGLTKSTETRITKVLSQTKQEINTLSSRNEELDAEIIAAKEAKNLLETKVLELENNLKTSTDAKEKNVLKELEKANRGLVVQNESLERLQLDKESVVLKLNEAT